MRCLDENGVIDFTQGRLSVAGARQASGHIDGCAECRQLVAEVLRSTGRDEEDSGGAPTLPPTSVDGTDSLGVQPTWVGEPAPRGSSPRLSQGTRVGRYVVEEQLGQGGMGVVFAAHDPELDRRISLKLLRADPKGACSSEGRTRLVREAQALARLAHPNVVAVHDVGTWEDQVFVAMELVPGGTLGQWLQEQKPGWRKTLELFLLAGRGLAAAHAAGLVHRDFKPDNVLMGLDGRVRVTDFGLARPDSGADTPATKSLPPVSGDSPLGMALTRAGSLVGTPAYMAPEQLAGGVADPRSDQFSFCVALYEGLYGERPFRGDSVRSLSLEVMEGRIRPVPRTQVPARLRKVVVKGLSTSSRERYESMEALLHALERAARPHGRSPWNYLTAAALLIAALAAVGVTASWRRDCEQSSRLTGIWDPSVSSELAAGFEKTQLPFARKAWERTRQMMDAYAAAWTEQSRALCVSRAGRAPSPEVLRQSACLEVSKAELSALVALMRHPDETSVDRAPVSAALLRPVSSCANAAAFPALPADEASRQRVHAARTQLAGARAVLSSSLARAQGMPAIEGVLAEARAMGYRPLESEALQLLSEFQLNLSEPKVAERTLQLAIQAAEATRDDDGAAQRWIRMIGLVGRIQERVEEARVVAGYAQAAVERAGSTPLLQMRLFTELGRLEVDGGRYAEGEGFLRRALALRPLAGPQADHSVRDLSSFLGHALEEQGRYDEALAMYQQGLDTVECKAPAQPRCAGILHNLSALHIHQGRFAEALVAVDEALALLEAARGPAHRALASVLINRGIALQALKRYDEAYESLRRAEAINTQVFGAGHDQVALAREGMAKVLLLQGKGAQAVALARASLQARVAAKAPAPRLAEGHATLARILRQLGRYREAVVELEAALALDTSVRGPTHPFVSEHLLGIGSSQLKLGQAAAAVRTLTRALEIRRTHPNTEDAQAVISLELAKATVAAGGSRAAALTMAREAEARLATSPPYFAEALAEARAVVASLSTGGGAGGGR